MSSQHKKKPKMAGGDLKLRIIGGQWRGRCLPFPEGQGLRPSGSRIRETLFNWLMPILPNSRCLDLYAGSGALGFEALSRGADDCLMFELNPAAARQLTVNAATLKADTAKITHGDTLALLKQQPAKPFDVIFLDPPFDQGLWAQTAALLVEHHWLSDDAYIYVETPTQLQPQLPASWIPLKQKKAGKVNYALYRQQTPTHGTADDE